MRQSFILNDKLKKFSVISDSSELVYMIDINVPIVDKLIVSNIY